MIDLDFLQRLIQAVDESSLDSIEIERGGTRVRLSKSPPGGVVASVAAPQSVPVSPAPAPAAGAAPAASTTAAAGSSGESEAARPSHLVEVTSPMVGTFYRAPAPDAPPYVQQGRRVSKGDTLCIIEAMKLMNELECEIEGTIAEILVDDTQPVEYGQVLFLVDPS